MWLIEQLQVNDNIRLIISSYRGRRLLIRAQCLRLGKPQTRWTPERRILHTNSKYDTIRYDTIYLRALESWRKASLVQRTAEKQKLRKNY